LILTYQFICYNFQCMKKVSACWRNFSRGVFRMTSMYLICGLKVSYPGIHTSVSCTYRKRTPFTQLWVDVE
jgi:hypothetical protein